MDPCNGTICEIPTPRLQNVVATFSMRDKGDSIDLVKLCMKLPFIEYNAKRFAAAVLRLVVPKTTCLCSDRGRAFALVPKQKGMQNSPQ